MDASAGVAFVAGILSFLSPCILPLVPGYISFLSGMSLEELRGGATKKEVVRRAGISALFFVLGFSLVFMALGASASFIGRFLNAHALVFAKVAGIFIVVLGLHLLGIFKIPFLNVSKRLDVSEFRPGMVSALLIGCAFGFGWTPCVGPLLTTILALAATRETLMQGVFLLGMYSAGLGIPFLITGISVGFFMRFFERYKRFIRWGEIATGGFLIIVGVLIFTDQLTIVLRYVPEFFYSFAQ